MANIEELDKKLTALIDGLNNAHKKLNAAQAEFNQFIEHYKAGIDEIAMEL